MTILTLTLNPALDKSSAVEQVQPNTKLRCDAPSFSPGGGGINVARAIRKIGGQARAVFPVGGPPGEILCRAIKREGVDFEVVEVEEWTRENLHVEESSTGQQYRFGMPGHELQESEWRQLVKAVTEGDDVDYLVLSGSLPPGVPDDVYARLVQQGRERGWRVVVDTSGEPLKQAAAAQPFLLKPNLNELETLAGRELPSEDDQERFARELVEERGVEVVVVSLAAGGALLVSRQGRERFRAPTVRINSRVGAGDSMVGGLVYALDQGRSHREAVLQGIAAGTAAVMTPGTELCRREDVDSLFECMTRESC